MANTTKNQLPQTAAATPEATPNPDLLKQIAQHAISQIYSKAHQIALQNYRPTDSTGLNHLQINDLLHGSLQTEAQLLAQHEYPTVAHTDLSQAIKDTIIENHYTTIPPRRHQKYQRPYNDDLDDDDDDEDTNQNNPPTTKKPLVNETVPSSESESPTLDPKLQPLEYIDDHALSQVDQELDQYLKDHQSDLDKLAPNQQAIAKEALKNQLYLEKFYEQTKVYQQKYPQHHDTLKDIITSHYHTIQANVKANNKHVDDIATANATPNPTKTKSSRGVLLKVPPQLTQLQQELLAAKQDPDKITAVFEKHQADLIHLDEVTILDPIAHLTKNPLRYLDPKVLRFQYHRFLLNHASPQIALQGHNPEIANLLVGTDSKSYLQSLIHFERQFAKQGLTENQIDHHELIIELREKYNRQIDAEHQANGTQIQLAKDTQSLYQNHPILLINGVPAEGLKNPLPDENDSSGNLHTYEQLLQLATGQLPRISTTTTKTSLSHIERSVGFAQNGSNYLPNLGGALQSPHSSTQGSNYNNSSNNQNTNSPLALTTNQAGTPLIGPTLPLSQLQTRLNKLSQYLPTNYRATFRGKLNRYLANSGAGRLARNLSKTGVGSAASKLLGFGGPIGRTAKIALQALSLLTHPSFLKFEEFIRNNSLAIVAGLSFFLFSNLFTSVPLLLSAVGFGAIVAGWQWLRGIFGPNPAAGAAHTLTHGSSITSRPLSLTEAGGIDAIETTITTTNVSFMDIVTPGIPGSAFFLTSSVAPFILLFFLTFIVMMHLLVAFSVPIPQIPEWGPSGHNRTPNYTPPPLPVPTGPFDSDVTRNCYPFIDPTATKTLVDQASTAACIPSALLTALLSVEAPRTLEFTAAEASQFDTAKWWQTANGGGNCYDQASPGNLSAECLQGYCYNTCATPGLCAAGADVRGAGQFEHGTFYGAQCIDNTPAGLQGLQGQCTAGHTNFVRAKKGESISYVPDRCLLSDNIFSAASKFGQDSHLVPYGTNYSCSFNAGQWNPESAKEAICKAAIAYCGSCGLVENPTHPKHNQDLPCQDYYRPGLGNKACGDTSSDGHCNMVYNRYIANLTSCTLP